MREAEDQLGAQQDALGQQAEQTRAEALAGLEAKMVDIKQSELDALRQELKSEAKVEPGARARARAQRHSSTG